MCRCDLWSRAWSCFLEPCGLAREGWDFQQNGEWEVTRLGEVETGLSYSWSPRVSQSKCQWPKGPEHSRSLYVSLLISGHMGAAG